MNFTDWYTDRMDVYRVSPVTENHLTKHERVQVYQDIPCRVYSDGSSAPTLTQNAASVRQNNKVALDNKWDIKPGDELIIRRGAAFGYDIRTRCFAGEPHYHFEPYGGVVPKLAHQEITLLQEERI